jgi:hypothetical protein
MEPDYGWNVFLDLDFAQSPDAKCSEKENPSWILKHLGFLSVVSEEQMKKTLGWTEALGSEGVRGKWVKKIHCIAKSLDSED